MNSIVICFIILALVNLFFILQSIKYLNKIRDLECMAKVLTILITAYMKKDDNIELTSLEKDVYKDFQEIKSILLIDKK